MTARDVQNIQIVQDVQREEEKDRLDVIDLASSQSIHHRPSITTEIDIIKLLEVLCDTALHSLS